MRHKTSEEIIRSTPWGQVARQNCKKSDAESRKLSRVILRCWKCAQSIQLPRITYILAQGHFQTPSELRARSRRQIRWFHWKSNGLKELWQCQIFQKSPSFHRLSRSSSIRSSSCSTVLMYSSVLSNCKVSAPSDPWWWRYLTFGVSDPSKSLRIGWIDGLNLLGAQNWSCQIKVFDFLHHYWSSRTLPDRFCEQFWVISVPDNQTCACG